MRPGSALDLLCVESPGVNRVPASVRLIHVLPLCGKTMRFTSHERIA